MFRSWRAGSFSWTSALQLRCMYTQGQIAWKYYFFFPWEAACDRLPRAAHESPVLHPSLLYQIKSVQSHHVPPFKLHSCITVWGRVAVSHSVCSRQLPPEGMEKKDPKLMGNKWAWRCIPLDDSLNNKAITAGVILVLQQQQYSAVNNSSAAAL